MDEFTAILRARDLIKQAGIDSAPVEIEEYLKLGKVKAIVKVVNDLPDDQAGSSTVISGRHVIFANGKHSRERQRFTVFHELGHIVLNLPSSHSGQVNIRDLYSYRRRPQEEVFCDIFAAELLLPEPLFRSDVANASLGFNSIERLALKYEASLTSTGSRFAVLTEEPCAFILGEAGSVRYVSYSRAMREQKGWISFGLAIPEGTLTAVRLKRSEVEGPMEIEAYRWLENEKDKTRYLLEDVRLLVQWNQSLTLIWFEDTDNRENHSGTNNDDDDETGLRELDGALPWPSKRRRR